MNLRLKATISEELEGERLDTAMARLFPEYSRARLQSWIKAGQVMLNEAIVPQRTKVKAGQTVEIETELSPTPNTWEAEAIPLDIVYEDESLLVIHKPVGLVVHPGAGHHTHTLLNAVLHHAPALGSLPRAGIVHRLDKDTSGLLIIAKTLSAHHALVKQLQQRTMKRHYQAIVQGILIAGGSLTTGIGRHPTQRTKMAIREAGKLATTHYRVKERFRAHTLLELALETGRTHQIRVHMAHLHHPIVGDPQYGGRLKIAVGTSPELMEALQQFKRQALHAWRLEVTHPTTHQALGWEIPLPADMQHLLTLLRQDRSDS